MRSCISDAALSFKKLSYKLITLYTIYGDYILHVEDTNYFQMSERKEENFTCKAIEYDKVRSAVA